MIEEKNKFLEFLKYQINQKNRFDNVIRKIPLFKNKIEDCHYTILKMIDIRRREIYNLLVNEFNSLLKKK
ncbi:MAG: hypothetical protein ACFE8E_03310 [Candidatus Hodarchaeota archaeon]